MMFGKPQWFRPKTIGWGIMVPATWQGWLYTSGWAGAIGLPFFLLVMREQPLEALAWLGVSIGAMVYDVWQMRRSVASRTVAGGKQDDNVLYILDSQPGQQAATRNYNLQVRR
jgi:hypothetical protein